MIATFRSGKRSDGTAVQVMPIESLCEMSGRDLRAFHLYLKGLPRRGKGGVPTKTGGDQSTKLMLNVLAEQASPAKCLGHATDNDNGRFAARVLCRCRFARA